MNPCWVIVVTRGLRIWLPPEVYLQRDLALREADRWRMTFHIPEARTVFNGSGRALAVIQTLFPESWRACPLWVGVSWSANSYPKLTGELMAADEGEATDWLRSRTPRRTPVDGPSHVEFERRGVLCGVGIARAKRVLGF